MGLCRAGLLLQVASSNRDKSREKFRGGSLSQIRIMRADWWPVGEEPWRKGEQLEQRRLAQGQANCQLPGPA